MVALVLAVGLPSAWRNLTALALVLSWAFGYVVYVATGDGLALKYYVMADIAAIAMIACKKEARNLRPYRGAWHQLQCMILERSPWDRIVLLIFPLMWTFYVVNVSDFARYWALYLLYVIQLLASGGEALQSWLAVRKANARQPATPDDSGAEHRWALELAGCG